MLDINDFVEKQVLFVYANEGDKISFSNDNILIKDKDGKIKHQSTCYRLLALFIIGNTTITTPFIAKARKFGYCIVLFSQSFRVYEVIGSKKEANFLLHKSQYEYNELDIGKYIISNKIFNQLKSIKDIRYKTSEIKSDIDKISNYMSELNKCNSIQEIMGYEGLASKLYFKHIFRDLNWITRRPRIKNDVVNASLDIGYTILFTFIEVILNIYGFDTYCGVLHRMFYMRKSLVCDIIEPFRVIIDIQTKNSFNLGQFKKDDFEYRSNRFDLKWEESKKYVSVYLSKIMEYKKDIFLYIQSYYRAFMRKKEIINYPIFEYKRKE